MNMKTQIRVWKSLVLGVAFLVMGEAGWGLTTDYYWIGGASGTINDGTKWAESTGGLAIGGTIAFANDYTESLHFDGNSGASDITVTLNAAYFFDHFTLVSNQKLTLYAASSLTIEVLGVTGGNTLSEFAIGTYVKVMNYGHIDGGDNTLTMNRVTINGILESAEWVNADYFAVNTGALFRTSYVSTGEGWWYGLIATPGNNITANGQIEYMGNGQAVVNISYYDLLFSGDAGGAANILKGTNLHVTHKIEILAPFNLSTNGLLYFKGTSFINNTAFSALTGTISNADVTAYTEKTYSGTGSIQIGTFSNSSGQRIDIKIPVSTNNAIFDGTSNIDNSYGSTFTVGIGSTDCSITLDGVGTKNVGTFTVAPTFGSGALTINYNKELSARTTGYEMPSSFAYLVIKNDKGVTLNSDKTITGSANVYYTSPAAGARGKLDLNGKVLHYTGTGNFTNGGTLLGSTGSTISFENSSAQTLSLTNSTSTLIDVLKVNNTGLTVSATTAKSLVVNNVYFNYSGGITRTNTTMTIGSGGDALIEFNNTHGGVCGNFATSLPTLNVTNSGTSGLTIHYYTESAARTVSYEMPSTLANIYVSNTHGVVLGANKTLTGNLDVTATGFLTLNSGYALTVGGTLANLNTSTPGGVRLSSSSNSSSGSLMIGGNSGGGFVTYDRWMTGGSPSSVDQWHLISSPVDGQTISSFISIGSNPNSIAHNVSTTPHKWGLAYYDNTITNWGWVHYSDDNVGGSFTSGKGYEVFRTADGVVSFTGTVPVSTVNIGITSSGDARAWNLIGNPFPSAINANINAGADNFLSVNNTLLKMISPEEYVCVYIWNQSTALYEPVNEITVATYIPPGQAFFVRSKDGGATASFSTAMRTHQTAAAFKSVQSETPSIILNATIGNKNRNTKVFYLPDMTLGVDPGYDAGMFEDNNPAVAVYTHLQGSDIDFAIQSLPDNDYENIVVPVGINAPAGSKVVITADITNLPGGTKVYVEDRLANTFTRLDESGSYFWVEFTSAAKGVGRFYLHTKQGAMGIEEETESNLSIVALPREQKIKIIGTVEPASQATLYDMNGSMVVTSILTSFTENEISVKPIASGIYLLQIQTGNTTIKKKINWVN